MLKAPDGEPCAVGQQDLFLRSVSSDSFQTQKDSFVITSQILNFLIYKIIIVVIIIIIPPSNKGRDASLTTSLTSTQSEEESDSGADDETKPERIELP